MPINPNRLYTIVRHLIEGEEKGWHEPVNNFYNPAGGLPPMPAIGNRYIASGTARGWFAGNIYEWNGKSWTEEVTLMGAFVLDRASGIVYRKTGATTWTPESSHLDHSLLMNLGADDHLHYHTDARGDARYYQQAQVDAFFDVATGHDHDGANSRPVDYANIANKAVVNADVDPGAAIAEAKLAFDAGAGHDHDGVGSHAVDHGNLAGVGAADHHAKYTDAEAVDAIEDVGNGVLVTTAGVLGTTPDNTVNWDAAFTHVSNDGSSHTFIDQDVTSGSSPTFDGANFSGIPDTALDEDHYTEAEADARFLQDIVDDTTPQLGGDLELEGFALQEDDNDVLGKDTEYKRASWNWRNETTGGTSPRDWDFTNAGAGVVTLEASYDGKFHVMKSTNANPAGGNSTNLRCDDFGEHSDAIVELTIQVDTISAAGLVDQIYIICHDQPYANGLGILYIHQDGSIYYYDYALATQVDSTFDMDWDKWYHVKFTFDTVAGTYSAYIKEEGAASFTTLCSGINSAAAGVDLGYLRFEIANGCVGTFYVGEVGVVGVNGYTEGDIEDDEIVATIDYEPRHVRGVHGRFDTLDFITWRDAAPWDYTTGAGTLTADNAYHTKDASGIIDQDARTIIMLVDLSAGDLLLFKLPGAANRQGNVYDAGSAIEVAIHVPVDGAGHFDYQLPAGANCSMHIAGWY